MAEAVAVHLRRRGDAVDHAVSRDDAEALLAVQSYDLIILDINLPDGNGIDLLAGLRRSGDATPVLMLTARLEVDDRVEALDLGADDYLVKPFDLREVEARVRALARRSQREPATSSRIVFGDLEVDLADRTVTVAGKPVTLARREFSLLETLIGSRGRVITKDSIFEHMFSFGESDVGLNAVEIYVARLRKKLEGSRVGIRTLRGLGYQLVSDDDRG